ncbi:TPA: S-adenosylmethionine synthetase [Streptococcus suis]|nr:S-adenosylmethionine synthetase [Streptococcus suis]
MFEKVNPQHPDKIADRIAGALVDLAYIKDASPKIAVEVLIGHGKCHVITETNIEISAGEANEIVQRIAGDIALDFVLVPQDKELRKNQSQGLRCGDNGIFKGVPVTQEEAELTSIARAIYAQYPFDGKYILNNKDLIVCQSNAEAIEVSNDYRLTFNPLGYWTGGPDVDTGATNRKLGSDMARSVTGGGLHGKDLSKADVSVNIYAFLEAQRTGKAVELCCAIGDEFVGGKPYSEIVGIAKEYIDNLGGFEKLAEWGLV